MNCSKCNRAGRLLVVTEDFVGDKTEVVCEECIVQNPGLYRGRTLLEVEEKEDG